MMLSRATPADPDLYTPEWLVALRGEGAARREAIANLHDLLLRAARFEVSRRRAALTHVRTEDLDHLALQAADDALVAVLAKLPDFDGARRFTTWACKFALLEAGVRLRRRAWRDREVVLESENWSAFLHEVERPDSTVDRRELVAAIRDCIADELTPHQRRVIVALAIDGVPIDVLAERLATTRGALYEALHDGRRQLRARLTERALTSDR